MLLPLKIQSTIMRASKLYGNPFYKNPYSLREIKIKFGLRVQRATMENQSKHSLISVVSYSYLLQTLFKYINYCVVENHDTTVVESKDYTYVEPAAKSCAKMAGNPLIKESQR